MFALEEIRINNFAKIKELGSALNSFEKNFQNQEQAYAEQFDQLMKMKDMRSVAIEDGRLVIYTKKITLKKWLNSK